MKYMLSIVLFMISSVAVSNPVWHTAEINSIYPLSDGSFVISFKENSDACRATQENKYHYVRADKNGVTVEGVKAMLSVALTAASIGKRVSVNFDDGEDKCYVNRLVLYF